MNFSVVYVVTSAMSANIFGLYQIRALNQNGFDVYLICGKGEIKNELRQITKKIYTIEYLNRNISLISDALSLIKMFIILKDIRPSAIIYSTPKSSFLTSIVSSILGIKFRIYQIWGLRWQNFSGLKLNFFILLEKMIIRLSTNGTVVSKSVKGILDSKIPKNDFKVLGQGSTIGVDPNYFFLSSKNLQNKTNFVLGYAGRISPSKGIYDLIKVFQKISPRYENLKLEIIGEIDNSDKEFIDFFDKIVITPNIQWIKEVSQQKLASYMRNWDLQVFLSEREGLGNVILEAGACGVPTICWNLPGMSDAIPKFMDHLLVPFKDFSTLSTRISHYIENPISEENKGKLRDWYILNFSQDLVLRNFLTYILSLKEKGLG